MVRLGDLVEVSTMETCSKEESQISEVELGTYEKLSIKDSMRHKKNHYQESKSPRSKSRRNGLKKQEFSPIGVRMLAVTTTGINQKQSWMIPTRGAEEGTQVREWAEYLQKSKEIRN